jgi:hypothetical protein
MAVHKTQEQLGGMKRTQDLKIISTAVPQDD